MPIRDELNVWHPQISDAPTPWGNAHIFVCPICRERMGGPAATDGELEAYRSGVVMLRMTEAQAIGELWAITKGINRDELDPEGWWETSAGAEFGKGKLAQLEELIRRIIRGNSRP